MTRGNSRAKRRRLRAVIARDGATCWLCGQPLDLSLPRDHDHAATLDHVHPRSIGGPNAIHNLKVAHRACNLLAGLAHQRHLLDERRAAEVLHGTRSGHVTPLGRNGAPR